MEWGLGLVWAGLAVGGLALIHPWADHYRRIVVIQLFGEGRPWLHQGQVREVKVVTNGFAPEFGQTTGMVYNAITQSGTNLFNGSASYRFKRNSMSAPTFFLAPGTRKPDTKAEFPKTIEEVTRFAMFLNEKKLFSMPEEPHE